MLVQLFGIVSSLGVAALLSLIGWQCAGSRRVIVSALRGQTAAAATVLPWADQRSLRQAAGDRRVMPQPRFLRAA